MSTLDGRVALVTGGARGIGAETARMLADTGATVFVTDILEDLGKETADGLPDGRGRFLHLDVTDEGAWQTVMEKVEADAGRLDVLVNNAGIEMMKPIEELSLKEWQLVCRINLDGVFLGTRAAVGLMKREKEGGRGGSIVNISSVAGLVGTPFQTAYGMTKGGVRTFSKGAALEFAALGYGIRVNSVHPGVIETAMGDEMLETLGGFLGQSPEETAAFLKAQQPLGLGQPRDIASMILFLASDDSRLITGAEFVVDGGLTAQ